MASNNITKQRYYVNEIKECTSSLSAPSAFARTNEAGEGGAQAQSEWTLLGNFVYQN